jgi:CCR4-NOT transcription complex subunit 7/8
MEIIQVWNHNIDSAVKKISKLIDKYSYVAMDTEFPGIVARPITPSKPSNEYQYQTLRCNVDLLQIIQLGIAFADENGNLPQTKACWQFNFHFNLKNDMFAQDSIDLLIRSGVKFEEHEKKGIETSKFARLLITSGLVLNKEIKWISFHSGYDFGYLVKILTQKALPIKRKDFFDLLRLYFPCSYDMKYLSICSHKLHGGLNKLAEKLNVLRIGQVHQAGSDSLLTLNVFFKLKKTFFKGIIDPKYQGLLYGLGISYQEKQKKNSFFFEDSSKQTLPVILL